MPHFPPLFPEVGGVGVTIDCCINVVWTRSTGFRTNKRYAILLEFLGDLCLKVSFCLSVIPFSRAINVISTRNVALV